MKKTVLIFFTLLMLVSIHTNAQSQCKVTNNQFNAGEELSFDLYFKYGLIFTKAGNSSLKTVATHYGGKDAYKMSLIAQSTGAASKLFSLNDTLSSYVTKDLVPLHFKKNAHEGKENTDESVTYTYTSSGVNIHTKRIKNGEQRFDETFTSESCVYDMISVVYYARTLNYSSMKKGDSSTVEFISGKKKVYMTIEYGGLETIKANDNNKYECIKLVLSITNGNKLAFEDKEEAMKVYITNDENKMPVRLDSKLKVGSTRAMLKSYKGNRYTVKTK